MKHPPDGDGQVVVEAGEHIRVVGHGDEVALSLFDNCERASAAGYC